MFQLIMLCLLLVLFIASLGQAAAQAEHRCEDTVQALRDGLEVMAKALKEQNEANQALVTFMLGSIPPRTGYEDLDYASSPLLYRLLPTTTPSYAQNSTQGTTSTTTTSTTTMTSTTVAYETIVPHITTTSTTPSYSPTPIDEHLPGY